MKIDMNEANRIILRAAGEEASIFDVLNELRVLYVEHGTFSEFLDSCHESLDLLDKYLKQERISLYNDTSADLSAVANNNIYKTYLYIPDSM
jgi:hypothetical protein